MKYRLIGRMLEPLQTPHRKAISKAKFYFFDVGVVNSLAGNVDRGRSFELLKSKRAKEYQILI